MNKQLILDPSADLLSLVALSILVILGESSPSTEAEISVWLMEFTVQLLPSP